MNKRTKEIKMTGARRQEHLEGELIMKCCDLVHTAIRMASHILEAAHLEFEALMTVMILVNADFLAKVVRLYKKDSDKQIIDTFLDEVRLKTDEMIKEDSKDKNAN